MADAVVVRALRERLASPETIGANGFALARDLCGVVNAEPIGADALDPKVQELVLRALEQRAAFGPAAVVVDGLVRRLGLFPYLDPETLGLADTIAYEYHRPENMGNDIIFHRVQAEVYRYLLPGQNVILSAPTSFGKSLIVDAMIASGRYRHIAIVVPTIALIDETRRRLAERFGRAYKVITHPSQRRGDPELLIMTQERLLELPDLGPIDFFVIDEFYKLQPRQEDAERSLVLNQAFYRLHKTGAQFYLLGPNIEAITNLPDRVVYQFIKTDYKTVVSQVHRVRVDGNDLDELVRLCRGLADPTLIFCRSPQRVRDVAQALLDGGVGVEQAGLRDAVAWIGEQYHPDWVFARALAQGIGQHHGQVPRSLAQFVVRAFNEGTIKFLVCTSTLIEGVNTKAKNVIVLDNRIARQRYDFFTHNNIVGRSGRMFQHFVGHVYLFNEPPPEQLPMVDVPIFTQPENAPASLLIQVDEQDLGAAGRERIGDLLRQDELDMSVLRESRGIDPRALVRLAKALRENAAGWAPNMSWSGQPTHAQLRFACNLIWEYFTPDRRAGVLSANQLAFRIENLRQGGGPMGLLRTALRGQPEDPSKVVEETIEMLRYWGTFHFPKYLLALDRVQRAVLRRAGLEFGNYAFFAHLVENWFLDPAIMTLDEYGIPIQIGERLKDLLQAEGDLDVALSRLRALHVADLPLSAFERTLVQDAIDHL